MTFTKSAEEPEMSPTRVPELRPILSPCPRKHRPRTKPQGTAPGDPHRQREHAEKGDGRALQTPYGCGLCVDNRPG